MKIKALAITSLLVAAGALQGQAQNSINAVGYVKKTFGEGFTLFSNPLIAEDNTVASLMPSPPIGTIVYKFVEGSFVNNTYVGAWLDTNMSLQPGEGAFIFVPEGQSLEAIFVGEVPQGTLTTEFPAGFSLAASQVPQAGTIATDLGLDPASVSNVYTFNTDTQGYSTFASIPGLGFLTEPTIAIGEAVFLESAEGGSWTREFTVSE